MRYFKKRCWILIIAVTVILGQAAPALAAAAPPGLHAKSAIVIDADTGKILYAKDSSTRREPASVTKIVTCMLALEKLKPDQVITVSGKTETLGDVLHLKQGERIKVKDLLYGLMVYSANDAAVVLAKEMGGTEARFATMMNRWAKAHGAKNTHFMNPNGLNWPWQRKNHYSTARDLAVLTRQAMKNPAFRQLISTAQYTIPATNKSPARTVRSTDLCLWDTKTKLHVNGQVRTPKYEGVIGVKTGLTGTAGGCYVGAVRRNGATIISVVLYSGTLTRFSDSIALWDYTLDTFYDTREVVKEGQDLQTVRIKAGAERSVMAVAQNSVCATMLKGAPADGIRTAFTAMAITAPVEKGQIIGTVKVYNGDKLMSKGNAAAAVAVAKGGPLSYIGIPDRMAVAVYVMTALIIGIIVVGCLLRKKEKHV